MFCLRLLAAEYVAESGGDMTGLSEAQVDNYMSTRWERRNDPEEKVADPDRLMAIQLKNQLGISLTKEDSDAIDPDKRTPGINRMNKDHNLFLHRFKIDNKE